MAHPRTRRPAGATGGRTSRNQAGRTSRNRADVPSKRARAGLREWIGGARLRTLPLALGPVVLGTAVAHYQAGHHLGIALLCLGTALFLQIGVNFANDYSDGIRGTDRHRVGPARLTGSGAAAPRTVLLVALGFLGLGALSGLGVVLLSGIWWLLAVGAVALLAAWFYTGGRRPYGYRGLGEVVAFTFFGPVAAAGTTYVQIHAVPLEAWLVGVAAGLFAAAVMLVNNLRDRDQDAAAGKRTLSVLIGDRASRVLFALLALAPYAVLIVFALLFPAAHLVYFSLLTALPAVLITLTARTAKEFVLALQLTSLASVAFALGLAAAIAL